MQKESLKTSKSVLDIIGNTPLIRLNKIPQEHGVECQIFAKIEGQNPGASIKDRIAVSMLQKAEDEGKLKGVDTIVEASSGNTGMGVALVSAIKGYQAIITIQDRMSSEKINRLKALGAKVIICPSGLPSDHPQSYLAVAEKLALQDNVYYTDQYNNFANVDAHFNTTAQEIYQQMQGKVDYFFCGVGSGGSITGCSQFFRKNSPNTKVIGVDPDGSQLALPAELNKESTMIRVEGIGKKKPPHVLDRSIIDGWVKVSDKDSFQMARQIIQKEGIFCGGSCGSALIGTINYLKSINVHKNKNLKIVLIFPDSTTNYLTRFMKQEWMVASGYQNWQTLLNKKSMLYNYNINKFSFIKETQILNKNDTINVAQVLELFSQGIEALPIVSDNEIVGVLDKQNFQKMIFKQKIGLTEDALQCRSLDVYQLPYKADFSVVQQLLEDYNYIFLTKKNQEKIEKVYTVNHQDILKCYEQITQANNKESMDRVKKIHKLKRKQLIKQQLNFYQINQSISNHLHSKFQKHQTQCQTYQEISQYNYQYFLYTKCKAQIFHRIYFFKQFCFIFKFIIYKQLKYIPYR